MQLLAILAVLNWIQPRLSHMPGYLKAYHRRGKAYSALAKYELAIKDFQFILEEEPDNKDVNKDLKEARTSLNDQLSKEP
jgi:tetratricopeptide (TPR) repeat protein